MDNQNRVKKHIKNVLLYMTSASTLLASCDAGYYAEELLSSDEHFAANEKEGVELLPIDIYIDAPTKQKMANISQFASQFAHDVASQQGGIIDEMNSNPQAVLDRYGLSDFNLDRNSLEVQAILALGDPEVQASLQNGDFRRYIQVLNEKGLLQSDKVEQITKILQDPGCSIQSREADAWFVPFPVVALALAVVSAAVYAGMVLWTESYVYGANSLGDVQESETSLEVMYAIERITNDSAMRLWIDANSRKFRYYSLANDENNKLVDVVMSSLETTDLSEREKEKILQLCSGVYKSISRNQ